MMISGVYRPCERSHCVKEEVEKKHDKESGSGFKEIFDSEMKKLESPDRPKLNDSNTR